MREREALSLHARNGRRGQGASRCGRGRGTHPARRVRQRRSQAARAQLPRARDRGAGQARCSGRRARQQGAQPRKPKLDADAQPSAPDWPRPHPCRTPIPLGATLEQLIGATACGSHRLAASHRRRGVRALPRGRDGHLRAARARETASPSRRNRPGSPIRRGRAKVCAGDQAPGFARTPQGWQHRQRGSVKSFVRDHVFPADGEQVEIKVLMRDYRAWCAKRRTCTPLDAAHSSTSLRSFAASSVLRPRSVTISACTASTSR